MIHALREKTTIAEALTTKFDWILMSGGGCWGQAA
jgi:hypothetical protein